MGIILFVIDTSASMNQRTYLGTSYLDVAKVAIEMFMKVRPHGHGQMCQAAAVTVLFSPHHLYFSSIGRVIRSVEATDTCW